MDLLGMDYFVAVAELGSLTAAAQFKFVSEPAISRKLRGLEGELGTKLYLRGPKGVRLTEAGRLFYSHAREVLARCEQIERELAPYRGTKAARPTLAYTTLGEKRYAAFLQKRLREAPFGLEAALVRAEPEEVPGKLLAGEYSLAVMNVCNLAGAEGAYEYAVLCQSGVSAYVAAGHPLFGREGIRIRDLEGQKITLFPRGKGAPSYDRIMAVFREAGVEPNVAAYITGTESFHMLIELEGYVGLMFSTSRAVLCSDKLHCIPIPELASGFDLGLAWKRGSQPLLSRHMAALADGLPEAE